MPHFFPIAPGPEILKTSYWNADEPWRMKNDHLSHFKTLQTRARGLLAFDLASGRLVSGSPKVEILSWSGSLEAANSTRMHVPFIKVLLGKNLRIGWRPAGEG